MRKRDEESCRQEQIPTFQLRKGHVLGRCGIQWKRGGMVSEITKCKIWSEPQGEQQRLVLCVVGSTEGFKTSRKVLYYVQRQ